MTTMIKRDAVIRLMDNNGFDCEVKDNEHHFIYESNDGFSMDFLCTWLTKDPLVEYPLNIVRQYMNKLLKSAEYENAIYNIKKDPAQVQMVVDALKDYGMVYDEEDETFYKIEDGKAIMGVDIDYLISVRVKSEQKYHCTIEYKDMLDEMYESAKNKK